MALIDLTQLRAAVRHGLLRRRVDEQLKNIRKNIKYFERKSREAWRSRNIRLGVELNEKVAAWRRAEQEYLAGLS